MECLERNRPFHNAWLAFTQRGEESLEEVRFAEQKTHEVEDNTEVQKITTKLDNISVSIEHGVIGFEEVFVITVALNRK